MRILKEALETSKYIRLSKKHPNVIFLKDFPFYKRIRAKGYANDLLYEFLFETNATRGAWQEFWRADIGPPKMDIVKKEGPNSRTREIEAFYRSSYVFS
jgi:moderate conductance mechanosensitive channel